LRVQVDRRKVSETRTTPPMTRLSRLLGAPVLGALLFHAPIVAAQDHAHAGAGHRGSG